MESYNDTKKGTSIAASIMSLILPALCLSSIQLEKWWHYFVAVIVIIGLFVFFFLIIELVIHLYRRFFERADLTIDIYSEISEIRKSMVQLNELDTMHAKATVHEYSMFLVRDILFQNDYAKARIKFVKEHYTNPALENEEDPLLLDYLTACEEYCLEIDKKYLK